MDESGTPPGLPNYVWWQQAGPSWVHEVSRRKRHRLSYHAEEVFLAEYFAHLAPARILEFGCGFGRHLRYLQAIEGLEVYGFDQSETLVAQTRSWAPEAWVEERVAVAPPLGPLPYPDHHFDVVFTVSVLIHNRPEHLDAVLRELTRVCCGHLLLVENVWVSETGFSSPEHDGCWLHPFEQHLSRLGFACERLASPFVEHDVYRVRVDPKARVVDLHPVAVERLREMQEQLTGFFDSSNRETAVRLAEMTADRDRLHEECRQRIRDYEGLQLMVADLARERETLREELGRSHVDLEGARTQLLSLTADRDRLWAEAQQLSASACSLEAELQRLRAQAGWHETELQRLRAQAGWHETELRRLRGSRSLRLAARVASAWPARLARRAVWVAKDYAHPAVRVRATGHRNPASAGCKVEVAFDGDAVRAVRGDGHWRTGEVSHEGPVWEANGQGTLLLTPSGAPPRLRFRVQRAGGMVEIRWRGRLHRVDLHREQEGTVAVDPATGRVSPVADTTRARETQNAPPTDQPRFREALARFQASGQEHLAIVPPDWLGINSAMRVMFGQVLQVPELLHAEDVALYTNVLLASGATKLVLGGFAKGYEQLIRALKRQRPGLRVYVAWCGNAAQHSEDYCRWAFHTVHELAEQGYITCVGHTKVGLAASLGHYDYPVRTLLLWYPPNGGVGARPLDDGRIHLGLFTAGSGWRKNVLNQITAAALVDRHALHVKVAHAHELDWARFVRANLAEVFVTNLPEDEFRRVMGRMHCNLYVTFSENGPLLPLQSLGLGVVSVIGPAGHLFRDHAYLREHLIVPYPDDPVVIADWVQRAVGEREGILEAYRTFCAEYIPTAQRSVEEFLGVE